jgi:hypothetical protein
VFFSTLDEKDNQQDNHITFYCNSNNKLLGLGFPSPPTSPAPKTNTVKLMENKIIESVDAEDLDLKSLNEMDDHFQSLHKKDDPYEDQDNSDTNSSVSQNGLQIRKYSNHVFQNFIF